MHRPTIFVLLVLCPLVAFQGCAAQSEAPERPNIVLLFADDLGYGDLSSYGHPTIRTPNLDRMARQGIRLTSFYAAPSCTPSRAALLTGRYPIRSGMTHVLFPYSETGLPTSEITLAEALKAEGYRTMAVGKWHLGHLPQYLPTNHGFDHFFGLPYSNDMHQAFRNDPPIPLLRDTTIVEQPVDQSTLTLRYTEEAVDFIRSSGDAPFFLYLAYTKVHVPLHVDERFRGQSRASLYGDAVEAVDWSVGRVLAALKEGLAKNTLVIFTSDNGPWLNMGKRQFSKGIEPWHAGSPGLLRGAKGTTWEGGVRVPMIARWPGQVPAGQESAAMATTMDLFTTLVKAAGGEVPSDRPIDGNDIMPLLRGETPLSPTEVFYYFDGRRLEAVREGPWKYHYRVSAEGGPALYHLRRDPSERYNVIEEHPEVAHRLREQMERFAEEAFTTEVVLGRP